MMTEVLPWKYNYDPKYKLHIIYGKDQALALSLARINDTIHIPANEIEKNYLFLFTEPLIQYDKPIKIICNAKLAQNIINLCKDHELAMNCILVVDANSIKCDLDNTLLVKCDGLNARSRKWFIEFHTKRIDIELSGNSNWINNLDDMKFAVLIEDLSPAYAKNYTRDVKSYDAWSTLKLKQIISKSYISGLLKHFEMWARDNVANEECLSIILHKILKEI